MPLRSPPRSAHAAPSAKIGQRTRKVEFGLTHCAIRPFAPLHARIRDLTADIFYPRELCPHCGSDQLAWEQPSGQGTVYSTTVIRRKAEAGGDYNVALVDLAEGPRMMSRVEGMAPADVAIGMAVQAEVIQHNGKGLVVFKAA